jgi:hypothetical protein
MDLMAKAIKEARERKLANRGIDTEVSIEVMRSRPRDDRGDA